MADSVLNRLNRLSHQGAGAFLVLLLMQDNASFRSNVELVVVSCTVTDANGAPVTDLTRSEFQLYDNNTRRVIQTFSTDQNLPLTLGVIMDASESQRERIAEHNQTVKELLRRILRPGDSSFLVTVDEDVTIGPGETFGEPCAKRKSNVPGLAPFSTCGASPLWNAVYDAARLKLQTVSGNKALLMLTDGFDSGSTHTWHQAADAVNKADASFYVIQYQSGLGGSFAPDLNQLVEEAGGIRFHPPNGDYQKMVSRIENDLRHRYVLGFRPDTLGGSGRHDVRIEVTRPELTVNARKTYSVEPRP